MLGRRTSVFGIYLDFTSLRSCVDALKLLSFRNTDISVLFPEGAVARAAAPGGEGGHSDAVSSGPAERDCDQPPVRPMQPLIGGTLGWLTYIHPAGTGVVSGALISMGVAGYDAERYEARIRSGGLLLCVRADSAERAKEVTEALHRTGAEQVASTEEIRPYAPGLKPGPVRSQADQARHAAASD